MAKRIWSINGRFLGQSVTGVQRYARGIVSALDALLATGSDRELDVEIIVPKGIVCDLELSSIKVRVAPGTEGHAWEQVVLPSMLRGGLLCFCNTGPVAVRKQIVCIHDANTRTAPQSYSRAFRLVYGGLLPVLGARASAIATVSEYSASQLARFGISRRDKIRLIAPNGHEHVTSWRPSHSPLTQRVAGPDTVVLIGSLAPHKNIQLILGLAPRLEQAGLRLAVVGLNDSKIFASIPGLGSGGNIEWLGRLPDDQMAALLQSSLCLCFPSVTEGFGLPVLEAMSLGCPVISSDAASLPEVGGDAVLYASPTDSEAWYRQILALRQEPGLADRLRADGKEQAKRFSWTKSAQGYLDLMADLDTA